MDQKSTMKWQYLLFVITIAKAQDDNKTDEDDPEIDSRFGLGILRGNSPQLHWNFFPQRLFPAGNRQFQPFGGGFGQQPFSQNPLFGNQQQLLQQQQQFQHAIADGINQFQNLAVNTFLNLAGGGAFNPGQPQHPQQPHNPQQPHQPPATHPPTHPPAVHPTQAPVPIPPVTQQPTPIPTSPPSHRQPETVEATTENLDVLINGIFTKPEDFNTDLIDIRVDTEEKTRRRREAQEEVQGEETDLDNRFGLGGILHAAEEFVEGGIGILTAQRPNLNDSPFLFPSADLSDRRPVFPQKPPPPPPPQHGKPPPMPIIFGGNHNGPVGVSGNQAPRPSAPAPHQKPAPVPAPIPQKPAPVPAPIPQKPAPIPQKPAPSIGFQFPGFEQNAAANSGSNSVTNELGTFQQGGSGSQSSNLATDLSSGQLSAANTNNQAWQTGDSVGNTQGSQSQSANFDKNTGQLQLANSNTNQNHVKDKDGERVDNSAASSAVNKNPYGNQAANAGVNTHQFMNADGTTGTQTGGNSQATNIGADGSLSGAQAQTNSGTFVGPGGIQGQQSSSMSSSFNQGQGGGSGATSGASSSGANAGSSTNSFGGNGFSGSSSSSWSGSGGGFGGFGGLFPPAGSALATAGAQAGNTFFG